MAASQELISAGVSDREADVLAAVGEHLTNAEIAARLYISVRTVESHVSSLLRKLAVADRRALADLAVTIDPAATDDVSDVGTEPHLPVPLTSFVGRESELAELIAAVTERRLVTALGPGGVGKSRLAIAVAADTTDSFADGAWFIDLVPVTDAAMIGAAVADVLGVCGTQRTSIDDAVVARLAPSNALLVLDNCEHVLDGVAVFVERLLASCPRVVVLATSRARLMLPFEWVFAVPGLDTADAGSDAVALFIERAAAVGSVELRADDLDRVRSICDSLDGMALAIELAAARLPSVGLDGIEAGLAEQLRLLSGGRRVDERHRSLRSAIDWSYALLDDAGQALARRVAVFASPFTVKDAAAIVGFDPIEPAAVTEGLAGLADQSLLTVLPAAVTRYRALETIRQYGEERLEEAGERDRVRSRHLDWYMAAGAALDGDPGVDLDAWRLAFDAIADDMRSALQWSLDQPARRADAYRLAMLLGSLAFTRGRPPEAQRRYEQAAAVADSPGLIADALRSAAGAASIRLVGNEAIRLWRQAADVAIGAGDDVAAARDLALAATMSGRVPGALVDLPPPDVVQALLDEARALSRGAPEAETVILNAEAFSREEVDPRTVDLAGRALALAQQIGDPIQESAALDMFTALHLGKGELPEALASVQRRVELLDGLRPTAVTGHEFSDAYVMASEVSVTVGDLAAGHDYAERLGSLPYLREEAHLANARQLKVEALSGDWPTLVTRAEWFRQGWIQAGRLVAATLSGPAIAVSSVLAMRGDDEGRDEWVDIARTMVGNRYRLDDCSTGYAPTYDAIALLHLGSFDAAVDRLEVDPGDFDRWYNGQWRPWYAAVWAEAAVCAGHPDAAARLERAAPFVALNPIAAAMVDRAAALHAGDLAALPAIAARLDDAGCRYQWARTMVFAGGDYRVEGEAALAAIGAVPMRSH